MATESEGMGQGSAGDFDEIELMTRVDLEEVEDPNER
jgi:hypothetical protein